MTFDVRQGSRCHLCGRTIVRGRCPVCDSAPAGDGRATTLVLVQTQLRLHRRLLAVPLLVAGTLVLLMLHVVGRATSGVPGVLPRAHAATPHAVSPTRPPVLRVNVPASDWEAATGPAGMAFAVRTGRGVTVLLTDYHLLVSAYLDGDHSVTVSLDGRPVRATVLAVSPDPHVATIAVGAPMPTLPLARTAPAIGDRVVVSAPGAGVAVSGRVVRYDGPGGAEHLAFTAVVPPQLTGAPVLNTRGQVVGVAEPSEQFTGADSIGFAVPIGSACRAVSC